MNFDSFVWRSCIGPSTQYLTSLPSCLLYVFFLLNLEILFSGHTTPDIGVFKNQHLDLVVSNIQEDHWGYWPTASAGPWMGSFIYFNFANFDPPQPAEFKMCIVAQGTNDEVVLDNFSWGMYEGGYGTRPTEYHKGEGLRGKLLMDVGQVGSYDLWPNKDDSNVVLTCEDGSSVPCPAGVKTSFWSGNGVIEEGDQSPPFKMTDAQKQRSVIFDFHKTSCWNFTFEQYCPVEDPGYTGDFEGCRRHNKEAFYFISGSDLYPPPPPPSCPDDVTMIKTVGVTTIDVSKAVTIVKQDTTTVTVNLRNVWSNSGDTIDHIFYQHKVNDFDTQCFEESDVSGDTLLSDVTSSGDITIQCSKVKPFATLKVCVADNDLDATGDDASVPACCNADFPPTPTVCYLIAINCKTACPVLLEGKRSLRGDIKTNTIDM